MEDKKLKILIADDEDGLRLSMAGILEMEGHEVLTAENGYEAVELAKQHLFDIAFLDIKMPGINGVDTFRQIKKISPETVVVMMTAYAVQHLIKEAINEGAYACMNKPFDMDKIMETIKDVSKKPFVMVIEDDPSLSATLGQKFKELGFNVVSKDTGGEDAEFIQRKLPDVVFLDITKKNLDPAATINKIKESFGGKCPKVIILTDNLSDPRIDEIKKLCAVDCMLKPKGADGLKEALVKLLDKDKKLKVCIVDDDQPLCESLKTVLTASGFEVDTAFSGDEAMKKFNDDNFNVAILDIRLPDVNGLEIYEKLKLSKPGMGVIFISGFDLSVASAKTVKNSSYTYLHKPFDPEKLIQLLDNLKEARRKE